jgi:putative alpha-1,2-mannosidase
MWMENTEAVILKYIKQMVLRLIRFFRYGTPFEVYIPLFTIIEQKRTTDIINTFLQQHKESGRLPMWELSANETNCMIGFHSVSVIADAMTKNITGFDKNAIYESMVAASNYTSWSIPAFLIKIIFYK